MLVKLLSSIFFFYRYFMTPRDYSIISEEIEYAIDHDMKYQIEDDFWLKESKDWEDEILDVVVENMQEQMEEIVTPNGSPALALVEPEVAHNGGVAAGPGVFLVCQEVGPLPQELYLSSRHENLP